VPPIHRILPIEGPPALRGGRWRSLAFCPLSIAGHRNFLPLTAEPPSSNSK
jgi:hypothetical protein